jgi:hypothetical protein
MPSDTQEVIVALFGGLGNTQIQSVEEMKLNAEAFKNLYNNNVVTDISEAEPANKLQHFILHQNYPNPFNPITTIRYSLSNASQVSLIIYNTIGQEVATLVNERQSVGNYGVNFDAGHLSSGVYFYKIIAGSFIKSRKMIVMR